MRLSLASFGGGRVGLTARTQQKIQEGLRMHRLGLILVMAACTFVATAPTALAQTTLPINGSYTEQFGGKPLAHPCPGDSFACGKGKLTGLGNFVTEIGGQGALTRTLTFTDGSTLVLEETFISFTTPGRSADSHASDQSFGHPFTGVFTFSVTGGTGRFAGATGGGTDTLHAAGNAGQGQLTGSLTIP
jgi:hypothetical protein